MSAPSPTAHARAAPGPSFSTLDLPEAQRANLAQLGYAQMTPVQAASLPLALAGRDLVVQAETGSGKTAAFALTLLTRLQPPAAAGPVAVQALVVCPTRELAEQVTHEIRRLARSEDNVRALTLCGGMPLRRQQESLAHGAHVVVGTPGRLLDHLERGTLDLGALRTLVLDEADRMLDMGFFDDVAKIVRQCPKERQTLMFSATYPDAITELSKPFLRSPQWLRVAAQRDAPLIEQRFYEVRDDQRLHAVDALLQHFRPDSTIAFCNTKQQCRDLTDVLLAQGHSVLALHGELEQRERDQVLVQFANRSCSVLVATDVAARGLDIAQLGAVINVDITPDPQQHIHRIGRTGRAQASGLALSLASLDEMGSVGKIEQALGVEMAWYPLSELTPRPGGPVRPAMVTLQLVAGRKDKIRAGDVLGALTGEAGLRAEQVGKIHLNDHSTYVAVDRQVADAALARLNTGTIKGKRVKVRRVAP